MTEYARALYITDDEIEMISVGSHEFVNTTSAIDLQLVSRQDVKTARKRAGLSDKRVSTSLSEYRENKQLDGEPT